MKKSFIPILIVILVFALCGCVNRQTIQNDLLKARQKAYGEWVQQKRQPSKSEGVIQGDLSLEKALRLALLYNKELQFILEEKKIAQGVILESYGEVLPNLSLNGNYTRLDSDSVDSNGERIQIGQVDNYSGILSVKQPLYRGGLGAAALRASRYYEALADENVRETIQNTIYITVKGYYQVLLARKQYSVTRTFAALAEAQLNDVKIKRKFGTASNFNVLRSEVEFSIARAEMIRYQNELHLSVNKLLKTLGVSQESRVKLTEQLTYFPLTVEEEEAVREAFVNRPDLAAAALAVKLQEESLNKAYSKYWPQIFAFYNHSLAKPDCYVSQKNEWDDAWNAGIDINIPIFDGLKREGRVVQERSSLQQSHIRLLDARETALLEVRNALRSLRDAAEAVDVQRLTIEQAKEGLRLSEIGFREGTLDQVSVLEANAALTNAQLLFYRSLYAHVVARLDLKKATGLLSPGTENTER